MKSEVIARLLPSPRIIDAPRDAFVAGAQVPLRHSHGVGGGTSLLMPAWDDRYYGVKIVNIYSDNRAWGLLGCIPPARCSMPSPPCRWLCSMVMSSRRDARAAVALGASLLARDDAQRLLIAGARRVGSLVGPAAAAVRALDDPCGLGH